MQRLVIAVSASLVGFAPAGSGLPPATFLTGCVRWLLVDRSRPGAPAMTTLVDNTHFDPEPYVRDITHPLVHAAFAWGGNTGFGPMLDLEAYPWSRGDAYESGDRVPVTRDLEGWTFDPRKAIVEATGHPTPTDLAWLSEDLEVPLPQIDGQPIPLSLEPGTLGGAEGGRRLAVLWDEGRVFDVASVLRHRVIVQQRMLHRAIAAGEKSTLGLQRLRTDWTDDEGVVHILGYEHIRSPHVDHPEAPFGREANGKYKYLIPTGRWWGDLVALAQNKRAALAQET